MTFRSYLVFMSIATAFAWGAWAFVLETVNPYETNAFGVIFFFVTLFLGITGIVAIIGSLFRVLVLRRKDVIIREVKVAFRHAILLSSIAVLSLFFLKQQLFHWWVFIVLIAVACVVEYVSLLLQQSRRG